MSEESLNILQNKIELFSFIPIMESIVEKKMPNMVKLCQLILTMQICLERQSVLWQKFFYGLLGEPQKAGAHNFGEENSFFSPQC